MKIYQILFFTISTVSFIQCSHQSNQNENNNAAYHIEFEDKNPNGGYGYKVQVSGKSKYQETWKKDRQNIQTVSPTTAESLNYLQNNYAVSAVTESVTKANDNIVADNYLRNSATLAPSITQNQYLNSPTVDATKNNVKYNHQQINNIQSSSSYQNEQINKNSYSSLNGYGSNQQQINDIPSSSYQTEQITTNPYSSLNSFASYNQQSYKPEISTQSKFSPQIHESNSEGWQVSSKSKFIPSASLPSNHYGSSSGPQVYVESTSGKLNQNQFTNQFELKSQANLPSEFLYQNSFQTPSTSNYVNIPTISAEYYQPSSQSKETNSYKTPQTSYNVNNQIFQLSSNANDNSGKYSVQYNSQYDSNDAISHSITQNLSNSGVQYYDPLSTIQLANQKLKHSNSKTIKYAPQYQSEPVSYSVPTQKPISNVDNNVYKQYIPPTQYSQIPQVLDYSDGTVQSQNILYKPTTLPSSYRNNIFSLPTSQLGSEDAKYNQNSPSLQGNPSIHFSTVYNELLQQYPVQLSSVTYPVSQNYQQTSPEFQVNNTPQLSIDYNQLLQQVSNPTKNIQYQNLYTVQQPTANKNVVSYQYQQELPSPKVQSSTSQNNEVNPSYSQYIPLNTNNPSELTNTYNSPAYGEQAGDNGISISQYSIYGKDNNQVIYVPGMVYGQGYQGANTQSLLNFNGYSTTENHGNLGELHISSPYQILRRSSGKHENNKSVIDRKQPK